ncbi:RNA polymerase sigma factor [Yoonia sp. SS1-5]|uniref:RNA polymerase sigma factor n=1 Tax=Yoonia rhodophyticola TaxID=3137370 RepID=A0AAN0M957_9RHOB
MDRDWRAQLASGDKLAMHALYLRHCDGHHAFARSRCQSPETAAGAVHDAMVALWHSAVRFKGQSTVETRLFSMTRNKVVDALRKRGRLSFVEEVPDSIDPAPNPEAAAIASQDRVRLSACIDALSPNHRIAAQLAFFEDMNYQEISEAEGGPADTTKTRIYHAKAALMRRLGG